MNLCPFCLLQHTSLSPDGKVLAIVGDNPDGILVDSQSGKVSMFSLSMYKSLILILLKGRFRMCGWNHSVEELQISNFGSGCLCRLSHLYTDTWITHLHLHGILMATFLPLGTKIKHVAFGISGTRQSLLPFLRATSELYAPYVSHRMDSTWQWLSQLTLCMSMMYNKVLRRSRRSISSGRYLVYLLAPTQNHFLLVSGIAPMEAFFSSIGAETIHILIACKFETLYAF